MLEDRWKSANDMKTWIDEVNNKIIESIVKSFKVPCYKSNLQLWEPSSFWERIKKKLKKYKNKNNIVSVLKNDIINCNIDTQKSHQCYKKFKSLLWAEVRFK